MLRQTVSIMLAAAVAAIFPWQAVAEGGAQNVQAQAVPLDESASAAEVKPAEPVESDRPPRKAPDTARMAGSGTHVVIDGDTLWDLSGRYLDNPFMWTEVWKVNPHIPNPHLIYPGDEVVLPGAGAPVAGAKEVTGMAAAEAGGPSAAQVGDGTRYGKTFGEEEPFVDMGKTLMRLEEDKSKIISLDQPKKEKIPVTTLPEILNAGFLCREFDDNYWTGPFETKRLYYTIGDEILVRPSDDIHIGDFLVTAKEEGEVDHPEEFFSDLGDMIQPTGIVQIKSVGGDFYRAEVVLALSEIETGDILFKFDVPETVYEPVPRNPDLKGKWGYVVSSKWKKINTGQSHYIYLDLGSEDGVAVGDVFEIRREEPSDSVLVKSSELKEGAFINKEKLPKNAEKQGILLIDYERPETYIGDAQVIFVQDNTCTARVMNTVYPVEIGQRAYYKD